MHALRTWLLVAIPLAIGTALLLSGAMLFAQAAAERRSIEERAQAVASAIAHAIEREIAADLALLRGLASSPALRADDLKSVYDQLLATQVRGGAWLILSDTEREMLNTLRGYGDPLPAVADYGREVVEYVERAHRLGWSVSDRFYGLVAKTYVVGISATCPRSNKGVQYILTVRLPEKRILSLVGDSVLPSGWSALILDRHGRLLVSTPLEIDWNAPSPHHWLADVLPPKASGLLETVNSAGASVQVAYARARNVEWTAAIEVPSEIVYAPIRGAVERLGVGGGLLLALGGLSGVFLARWWHRPIEELSEAAAQSESQRRDAEAQVDQTQALLRVSSNALSARLAIVDARGNIVFANESWLKYARSRLDGDHRGNYLAACETPLVRDALSRMMKGKRHEVRVTYSVKGLPEDSWFQARIARFEHQGKSWFVIAHEDVTEVKVARKTVHHLTDRLTTLQDEERQRIASELHDSTSQHLVAVGLNLMRLRSAVSLNEAGERVYRDINACLKEAQKELRIFTYLLYPPDLGREGLKATIERFVDGFANRADLKVRCRIDNAVDEASIDVQRAMLRVLQEALTNVHRHAAATRVLVLFQANPQELRLFVKDNGKGLGSSDATSTDRDVPLGVGIPGMRARIRRFGGTLAITSSRRGTLLRAVVPQRPVDVGAAAP